MKKNDIIKNTDEHKQKCSITLDTEIVNFIKKMADEEGRTFSSYINLVLKQHLFTVYQIEKSRNEEKKETGRNGGNDYDF